MSKKIYTNIDLLKNQLLNAVVGTVTTDPEITSDLKAGLLIYNSTDDKLRIFNGTKWIDFATSDEFKENADVIEASLVDLDNRIKSINSSLDIIPNCYTTKVTSGTSINIDVSIHKCGLYPSVTCYNSNSEVICNVACDTYGNITVSWTNLTLSESSPLIIKVIGK